MQYRIDLFGGDARRAFRRGPGSPELFGGISPAQKTGTMTRREGNRLVEEKQLSPAAAAHHRPAALFILTATNEPRRTAPTPFQQGPCRRIVDDAAIAGESATLMNRHDVTERRHSVLQRRSAQGVFLLMPRRGIRIFVLSLFRPERIHAGTSTFARSTSGVRYCSSGISASFETTSSGPSP